MRQLILPAAVLMGAMLLPAPAEEQSIADVINAKGNPVGFATLTQTREGVLVRTHLFNLPSGTHAFHFHTVGQCQRPEFTSAGGHFNPHRKAHGFNNPQGSHAGDLPNVHVGSEGTLEVEVLAHGVGLTELRDTDGSALMVHQNADDYVTDPAGNAGARIACGVIK